MTVYALLPDAKIPFHTSVGNLANGYKLFIYNANTTVKATTYTDSTGLSSNTNPIILNARGETTYGVYVASGTYKLVLAPSTDTDPPSSPIWSQDAITPTNNISVAESTEWTPLSLTPTYVSAVSFTVTGNQTAILHIGRRLKTTNSGGTVYSTISNSVFGAVTTVTVVNDSGTLDSGLSAVSYGFLSATNPSIPTNAGLATSAFDPAADYISFLDSSAGGNARALGQSVFGGVSLAVVATTSGATVALVASGMSSTSYKRIVINFAGVSLNGTDNIILQLYDQITGVITSGYNARSSYMANGASPVVSNGAGSGFHIATSGAAGTIDGSITLNRMRLAALPGADIWSVNGSFYIGGSTVLETIAGNITLTSGSPIGKLDGLRLICSGANNFRAGNVTVDGYV